MISSFLESPKVQLGESIAMKGTMLFTPQKQMWKKSLRIPSLPNMDTELNAA
jgi:hypothetical protein